MTKNRKLIRRNDVPEWAGFIDLDGLKAFAEAEMLSLPDEAWYLDADMKTHVSGLFSFTATRQSYQFWSMAAGFFTVEPLDPEAARGRRRKTMNNDNFKELKPCPFCGGPGYLCQIPSASGGSRYIWVAKCSVEEGCGVEFLGCSRKVDAIKEWNTRILESDNERLTRRIAVLEEALDNAREIAAGWLIGVEYPESLAIFEVLDEALAESKRIAEEV